MTTPPTAEVTITAELLKQEQHVDTTSARAREMALGEVKEGSNGSRTWYYTDKSNLYRESTSPKVEYGNEFRQVVVPCEKTCSPGSI